MIDLPPTARVVIIGGGVMGASTAYHLAVRGVKGIVLLESRPFFGQGATGKSAGGIRYQFSTAINIRLSQLSLPMLDQFEELTGQPIDLRYPGYLLLATTEQNVAMIRRNIQLQHSLGVATEWLEGFIRDYQGAVVVISHDRYFLDRTVEQIVEIERHRLTPYAGNYSAYVQVKAERLEQQRKAYEQQQAEIRRQEEFIRRNMAGQKTKQAQSRQKALDRLERSQPHSHGSHDAPTADSGPQGHDDTAQQDHPKRNSELRQ